MLGQRMVNNLVGTDTQISGVGMPIKIYISGFWITGEKFIKKILTKNIW
jgi:hypothetical protein